MLGSALLRVLVVDKQSECEDRASLYMRRWGNNVLTVVGDLFLMVEASDFAPELVMVHADRPEFDAFGLVKMFRTRHSFGSVPLIAMSTECDSECRKKAMVAGFDQWFLKPIPIETLWRLLAEVRAIISMPEGLAQRTIDQVALFDALKLEQDNKRRIERLDGP